VNYNFTKKKKEKKYKQNEDLGLLKEKASLDQAYPNTNTFFFNRISELEPNAEAS